MKPEELKKEKLQWMIKYLAVEEVVRDTYHLLSAADIAYSADPSIFSKTDLHNRIISARAKLFHGLNKIMEGEELMAGAEAAARKKMAYVVLTGHSLSVLDMETNDFVFTTGSTVESRQDVLNYLDKNHYTIHPMSVENLPWLQEAIK